MSGPTARPPSRRRDGERRFEARVSAEGGRAVVRIADNMVVGCEALMRWEHPERGTIDPSSFISIAEESNLIVQLGEWALRRAARVVAVSRPLGDEAIALARQAISHGAAHTRPQIEGNGFGRRAIL